MIKKDISNSCHSGINKEEEYGAYKIFFGTLLSKSRLKIIGLLKHGEQNVSEIINKLKMNQTSVSHDLARMRRCGFVSSRKDKKFTYYKLNKKTILPLMKLIDKHMGQFCIHILRNEEDAKWKLAN